MSRTLVLAPVTGRAVALADVPDPVFSQGMVGYGVHTSKRCAYSRPGRKGLVNLPPIFDTPYAG